ncbi:MAG: DUF2834 domain-containing protein [Cyanobacteria bacterium J06560_6]
MMDSLQNKPTTKSVSTLSTVYLLCLIVSIVVSWGIFSQFVMSDQASFTHFFDLAFANPVSRLLSSDILLTAPIFLFFASKELKRLSMPANRLVIYAVVTCSVGVCAALSLFLYQREVWQNKS